MDVLKSHASSERSVQAAGLLWCRSFQFQGSSIGDAPGGMILQARQHVGEPGLRICVVELGVLDQRVDSGGAPSAGIGAGEGPVVAADGDAAQRPLQTHRLPATIARGEAAPASEYRAHRLQQRDYSVAPMIGG